MVRRAALIAVWIVAILAWEGAYRTVGWKPWIFPAPSHVIDAALGLLNVDTYFGEEFHAGWPCSPQDPGTATSSLIAPGGLLKAPLLRALPVSGVRLALGLASSLAFGLIFGVALWRFAFLNSLLGPAFLGLQTLPSVCWVPLAILAFGISERAVLFVLILGSAFSIAVAMRDGLRALPPIYRDAGRMLGARGLRLYTRVLLPASLPALAGTLRQGFAFAWRSLLGAELILITQRRGLGFLLNAGREYANVAQVVAIMLVMVGIGMTIDRYVFAFIERRIRVRFGLADHH